MNRKNRSAAGHLLFGVFLPWTVLLSGLLLTGCSLLGPVPARQQTDYLLDKVPAVPHRAPTHRLTLVVTRPGTFSVYATRRIAYTLAPRQSAYFAKNRWAALPADMLQDLMVRTLVRTRYYYAVAAAPFVGQRDRLLDTQIMEMRLDAVHRPAVFKFVLHASLLHAGNNRVVADRTFSASVPVGKVSPQSAVRAANEAVAIVLRQLAVFCLQAH